MSEEGVLAALSWGTGVGSVADRVLAADPDGEHMLGAERSSQRVSHLVKRAIMVLESDRQGARRCLHDA